MDVGGCAGLRLQPSGSAASMVVLLVLELLNGLRLLLDLVGFVWSLLRHG